MWVERPMHAVGQEVGGFKKFLLRGNVVDLAVGVVIGASFGNVVQALVRDFLTPLLAMVGGVSDAAGLVWTVRGTAFPVGDFLTALLTFLLTATVVYGLVVVPVNRLMERVRPQEPAPMPMRECPECLSKVPWAAKRCAHCASPLTPETPVRERAA
jgi:large conductance mechanosensitive channel